MFYTVALIFALLMCSLVVRSLVMEYLYSTERGLRRPNAPLQVDVYLELRAQHGRADPYKAKPVPALLSAVDLL